MSSPTFQPTYLTSAPTGIEDNPNKNKPTGNANAEPTFEPTYLTYAPTAKKNEAQPVAQPVAESSPTFEPTYLTYAPTKKPVQDPSPTFEPTYLTFAPTKKPVEQNNPSPTFEPTYLTYAPTAKKKEAEPAPTFEPTYLTYAPTKKPTTGFPTIAPTKTHAPTVLTRTEVPGSDMDLEPPTPNPTEADSVEDSSSASGAGVGRPTPMPTPGKPTEPPTNAPTQKPTNPGAVVKADKYRNRMVGFQSDWGPAHPGSMIYDFTRNSIYVTGTNFAPVVHKDEDVDFMRSTCFVGELPIADIEEWRADPIPKPKRATSTFVVPDHFDQRETMGCHAIYYDDEAKDDALYVGTATDPDATARKGTIDAGINIYERTRYNPEWKLNKIPFGLQNPTKQDAINKTPVRWPVVMTSAKDNGDDIIMVLSVGSDDNLLTEEYIENGDANNKKNSKNTLQPPLISGDPNKYSVAKRGSKYFMSYQKYKIGGTGFEFKSGEDLLPQGETGEIVPTGIGNLSPASESFVFVGTTKGSPPGRFGMPGPLTVNREPRTDDYDGFATGIRFPMTRPTFDSERNLRFQSIESNPYLDDYAHGLCMPPPGPDGTIKSYYVIGSSFGTMPPGNNQKEITTNILSGLNELEDGNKVNRLSAWISKVDTRRKNDRSIVWTTQLFATVDNISLEGGMTEAFGCHVIDQDKSKIYVAGTVYNGGTMDSAQKSGGGDDVWVAQLNSDDGSFRWIKQIGSKGDDRLAKTNGIESDLNGHAIIYGETNGELYRRRRGEKTNKDDGTSTDIFVTTLDVDTGASESTIGQDRMSTIKMDAIIGASVTAVLVMVCIFFGYLFKWRRAKKYAAKDADGVLNTMTFKEDSEQTNLATGEYSTAPPKKAFKDSASDDGDDNGDASGGLSKFV